MKSGNYARFLGKLNAEGMRLEKTEVFDHYARNPGPEYDLIPSPDPSHRRRVASVKVLLSLRLFAAVRPGLSDTRLPEILVGARRKKTPNKGAEQGVPAPPRPAARFQNYPLLEECIRILLKP